VSDIPALALDDGESFDDTEDFVLLASGSSLLAPGLITIATVLFTLF
jgi:hypothetical protein